MISGLAPHRSVASLETIQGPCQPGPNTVKLERFTHGLRTRRMERQIMKEGKGQRAKGRGQRIKIRGNRPESRPSHFFVFPLPSFLCPLSSGFLAVAGIHRLSSAQE